VARIFPPAHLFITLNAIDFPEASLRAVEHCHRIRRGARQISVRHLIPERKVPNNEVQNHRNLGGRCRTWLLRLVGIWFKGDPSTHFNYPEPHAGDRFV